MNFKDIKNSRQFKSVTGLSKEEFDKLLICYVKTYKSIFGEWHGNNNTSEEKSSKLKDIPSSLFFILFQLKNDLVYDSLGAVFNMDGSNAHKNFTKYMAILKAALKNCDTYPKRYFKNFKEFKDSIKEEELLLDGTEQGIERPQDADYQEQSYSGKKKAHGKEFSNYK